MDIFTRVVKTIMNKVRRESSSPLDTCDGYNIPRLIYFFNKRNLLLVNLRS